MPLGSVLNDPDEAKKLVHEDFTFRYMGKIPIYAQGNVVVKSSYDKEAYFSEFLNVVGQLVPNGIVLTPVDVIADSDSAAVIMVGDAEGAFGAWNPPVDQKLEKRFARPQGTRGWLRRTAR